VFETGIMICADENRLDLDLVWDETRPGRVTSRQKQ
jgi:hypothetical protein